MNAIAHHRIASRIVLAVLAATVFLGATLSPTVAQAAGTTAVTTATTCQPGTFSSTMQIAGARNQTIAVEFYVQKYNFSTSSWDFHWRGGYETFAMSYVDPIDNSVGQAKFSRNINGVPPGYYVVWAHVWFYDDATRTWVDETWELPGDVDYIANGMYWISDTQYCNMNF